MLGPSMKLTPSAWRIEARVLVLAVVLVGAGAIFLWWKAQFVATFLRHQTAWSIAALGLVAALAWGGGRLLRTGGFAAGAIAAPVLAVLFVHVMVSPLPYELANVARDLPRPSGASPPDVFTSPFFQTGHPSATVTFSYSDGRDLSTLFAGVDKAFTDAGWSTFAKRAPSPAEENPYGFLSARSERFTLHCAMAMRVDLEGHEGERLPVLTCSLTV